MKLKFIKSYYMDRRQFIKINGKTSKDSLTILRLVMQGTVLGVIGFLIFINDLPHATQFASNYIFADDRYSIIQVESHEDLEDKVQKEPDILKIYYHVYSVYTACI